MHLFDSLLLYGARQNLQHWETSKSEGIDRKLIDFDRHIRVSIYPPQKSESRLINKVHSDLMEHVADIPDHGNGMGPLYLA